MRVLHAVFGRGKVFRNGIAFNGTRRRRAITLHFNLRPPEHISASGMVSARLGRRECGRTAVII